MTQSGEIKWDKVWECLFLIAVIVAIGMIVCTNLFHYCYMMNADIASEAVYARLIWELLVLLCQWGL